MIAVDTSALMAIVLGEDAGAACSDALATADQLVIAAATLSECLIVAAGRGRGALMDCLIADLALTVVPLDGKGARAVADAYGRWGKGYHPAALNYGDCFAYATAKTLGCPLLFVGKDFSRTDIIPALSEQP